MGGWAVCRQPNGHSAHVNHVIETYPARHGFVLRDTPAFDPAAHERHWRTLTKLLEETA